MEINEDQRDRFDALLEEAIESLPQALRDLIDQVPVIVEDFPAPDVIEEFRNEDGVAPELDEICGLHSGVAFTEREIDSPDMPGDITLYRLGIIAEAGGWDTADADELVYEQIMITLLHEIGHQFGLDEEDLRKLGYD